MAGMASDGDKPVQRLFIYLFIERICFKEDWPLA